jgi:endo-1,4-beta-xylanase
VISYTGTFDSTGNSYLAIHGWTQNPLIEYYIVERFGSFNPLIGAIDRGTVTADGSVYNIGVRTRINQVSIEGPGSTFQQFWSVRKNNQSSSGTVDLGAHFKAWNAAGMRLGANHYYQILVCEGYFSAGSCNMTVSEGRQI